VTFSAEERAIYEEVLTENAMRLHVEDCDVVIVHDPQPLPLVAKLAGRTAPWVWQCHVDLSDPNDAVWQYLRAFIEDYDLAVFSLPEYRQALDVPQRFITPAIDPFSAKNCALSGDEADAILQRHGIPLDRPIVAQISRFDPWKDPGGVIEAVRRARREVDCTLVLLGSAAVDDPETGVVLEGIQGLLDERVLVLTVDDALLVNALQRRAAVILQKSLREGFGLTVTEAMWKGAAVIGGNVGGIRTQISDGENGFLVSSIDEAAGRIVHLLKDAALRQQLGQSAQASVRERFLLNRLLEDWIDTIADVTGAKH
jgi:trehalose synthase